MGRVFDEKADSDKDVKFMLVPSIEKELAAITFFFTVFGGLAQALVYPKRFIKKLTLWISFQKRWE